MLDGIGNGHLLQCRRPTLEGPLDAVSRIRHSPGAVPFSGRGVGGLMGADQNSSTGNGCGARGSAQVWPGWGSST